MNIKRKIITSITLVIAGTIGIIYFIILPTIADINEIKNAVLLERIDLEKKYLRGQLLNKALEDFEIRKNEKENLLGVFIAEGEELEFVTSLEKIAEDNNVIQKLSLDNSQAVANQPYKTSILSVVSQGNFTDILNYLEDIKKLKYYYNINQMEIKDGSGEITVQFSGKIFIIPSDQKI